MLKIQNIFILLGLRRQVRFHDFDYGLFHVKLYKTIYFVLR